MTSARPPLPPALSTLSPTALALYYIGSAALWVACVLGWCYAGAFRQALGVSPQWLTLLAVIWTCAGGLWLYRYPRRSPRSVVKADTQAAAAIRQPAPTRSLAPTPPVHHMPHSEQRVRRSAQPERGLYTATAVAHQPTRSPASTHRVQLPLSLFGAYAVLPSDQAK